MPLAATLQQSGLAFDHIAANAHIGPWLQSVANARIHGTTQEMLNERLQIERQHFLPLPVTVAANPPIRVGRASKGPPPFESLQHPLSAYESLLEVA